MCDQIMCFCTLSFRPLNCSNKNFQSQSFYFQPVKCVHVENLYIPVWKHIGHKNTAATRHRHVTLTSDVTATLSLNDHS